MEFEKVRGQIESLWNEGLTEAGVRARRSGEAAGVERAVQAVEVLIGEHGTFGPGQFVAELRRRLSLPESEEPLRWKDGELMTFEDWERANREAGIERLTFAEWEERERERKAVMPSTTVEIAPAFEQWDATLPPGTVVVDGGESARREGDEERRVLVDRRGGEAPLPGVARDFDFDARDPRPISAELVAEEERRNADERAQEEARERSAL